MGYTRGVVSGQTFTDGTRKNPYQKFNFLVEIDDFAKAGFNTCTGLEKKVNVERGYQIVSVAWYESYNHEG